MRNFLIRRAAPLACLLLASAAAAQTRVLALDWFEIPASVKHNADLDLYFVRTIGAAPAGSQVDEEKAVLAAVNRLFETMRTRDTTGLRAVFEPGARLVGMRTRADGSTVLQTLSVDQFVGFVGRDTRAAWTERAFDPQVRIDGTLATVWAAYDFHFGSTFSHCGTDAVQLLKIGADWKIVGLADTFRTVNCPR